MPTRRAILKTGGASALILGAGVTGYAWYPGSSGARAPWSAAGNSLGDPRLDALAYAILAPNPHNRQPWWFELVDDDKIDVYADLDRLLPHTDPFSRQITIGFGCMLELLRQAAAEKGYRTDIEQFPDGEPQPNLNGNRIAQVTFSQASAAKDPLFASVLNRRSLKEAFNETPVTRDTLAAVTQAVGGDLRIERTINAAKRDRLVDIAWLAWMIEYETDATRGESIDLMRIGNRAVAKNPDGIDMGGLPMGLMNMAGIVTHKGLNSPSSTAYKMGIDMYRDIIYSARGFVWIISPGNSRKEQLDVGAAWVRLNLAAQSQGLGLHPLSQCLQEFPEMEEPYAQIHTELDAAGGTVQMLGRVGYAKFPQASPRWPLSTRLVSQDT